MVRTIATREELPPDDISQVGYASAAVDRLAAAFYAGALRYTPAAQAVAAPLAARGARALRGVPPFGREDLGTCAAPAAPVPPRPLAAASWKFQLKVDLAHVADWNAVGHFRKPAQRKWLHAALAEARDCSPRAACRRARTTTNERRWKTRRFELVVLKAAPSR
ncbi:hypothetical protein FGB62_87g0104 [Gracilaria domingensis]|nr:hypothetical protein FGB62_87g0104 [Gracilaria domingensis]